jgi:hypothetical protein
MIASLTLADAAGGAAGRGFGSDLGAVAGFGAAVFAFAAERRRTRLAGDFAGDFGFGSPSVSAM